MNSIMAESVTFAITESFQNERFIKIRTHDGIGSLEITGIVTQIDRRQGAIRVSHDHGVEWIRLDDILDVLISIED